MSKQKLLLNGLIKFFGGLVIVGLLLFLPAGTLSYPNAWLFIFLLFIPMLIVGAVLLLKAPELMEKRLNTRETEDTQKSVVLFSALIFVVGFILAGLDFRFQWLPLPRWLVIAAAAVQLLSYGLYAEVLRENAYLSRIVEVQENQTVVDTGLYGIVRHPMYAATVLLYLAIPLVLGSVISMAVFLLYIPIISARIKNEEAVLEAGLPGYGEYKCRVKYRLLPYVW